MWNQLQLEQASGKAAGYERFTVDGDGVYGGRRWRKIKGIANIELQDGTICLAELHWYEAHGVGSREFKIKRILD